MVAFWIWVGFFVVAMIFHMVHTEPKYHENRCQKCGGRLGRQRLTGCGCDKPTFSKSYLASAKREYRREN